MKIRQKARFLMVFLVFILTGCRQELPALEVTSQATSESIAESAEESTEESMEESKEEPTKESPEVSAEQTTKESVEESTEVFVPQAGVEGSGGVTEEMAESVYVDAAPMEEVMVEEVQAVVQNPAPAVSVVLTPEASGTRTEQNGEATIDYSHMEEGYVMVQYTAATQNRLKVQVKGPTTTYTYNLPQGAWTVFPLSDGNGSYQVVVYKNVVDTKYAMVLSASVAVTLYDEFAPFLRPNQYVNFSAESGVVTKGAELTAGIEDPLKKVEKVYDFVVTSLTYDKEKAASVTSGYLPVLDQVLKEKKGICFDYAALMTAMLRSQGVPCKLVVGYAGQTYHAWINVWTEKSGWVDGAIFFDGSVWKRMDPTFASSGAQSAEIMDYIGKDTNYTVKYLY